MYIPSIENTSESFIKRAEKSNSNDSNSTEVVAIRISTFVVIISWCFYIKYTILCLRGLIKHKNFNFLFPLTAAFFAFINNSNDIVNYIYHQDNCVPFYMIFIASATLNWAPISWLQAYRLALISKVYLSKLASCFVICIAALLSTVYCLFYLLNLDLFRYTKSDIIGCAVTNKGTWTPYVMVSDIADSVFSLTSICIIIYKSIDTLKELNTRNDKLKDLVSQGIIELLIIAISKIIIYPLIQITSKIPGLDVFWDVLSVIVIISSYRLVNFPHESNDNNSSRIQLRKHVFKFIDSSDENNISSSSLYRTKSQDHIINEKYIKKENINQNYSNKSSTKINRKMSNKIIFDV